MQQRLETELAVAELAQRVAEAEAKRAEFMLRRARAEARISALVMPLSDADWYRTRAEARRRAKHSDVGSLLVGDEGCCPVAHPQRFRDAAAAFSASRDRGAGVALHEGFVTRDRKARFPLLAVVGTRSDAETIAAELRGLSRGAIARDRGSEVLRACAAARAPTHTSVVEVAHDYLAACGDGRDPVALLGDMAVLDALVECFAGKAGGADALARAGVRGTAPEPDDLVPVPLGAKGARSVKVPTWSLSRAGSVADAVGTVCRAHPAISAQDALADAFAPPVALRCDRRTAMHPGLQATDVIRALLHQGRIPPAVAAEAMAGPLPSAGQWRAPLSVPVFDQARREVLRVPVYTRGDEPVPPDPTQLAHAAGLWALVRWMLPAPIAGFDEGGDTELLALALEQRSADRRALAPFAPLLCDHWAACQPALVAVTPPGTQRRRAMRAHLAQARRMHMIDGGQEPPDHDAVELFADAFATEI